ncbi:NAD(P)/FAD-dependent oxidoreductase [Gilvimarinus polysaccharolyticus]|uniref:NAD(P)/FAD-dependent oxidoreductase n=1 Tax=Gilvimarinus polysaccharolyticus TaxID=863921 RepID=UPI0006737F7A|nr:FAD-dependent oxidoreductase [Gilvimarinus polysaccharolyticus]
MSHTTAAQQTCIVIGASHGGVNVAFSLRKEGWKGRIILIDRDPNYPYHRPPLSKTYLLNERDPQKILLKPVPSYLEQDITLHLGVEVSQIDKEQHVVTLSDGSTLHYDKLVLALGARPIIPPIAGIDTASNLFAVRTLADIDGIRNTIKVIEKPRAVIIGGGYIGLETAASLTKIGVEVTVLEREDRLLARVTTPYMSEFFNTLHSQHGVAIHTGKNVTSINQENSTSWVQCSDGSQYSADVIIVGVGIKVNQELAQEAGLHVDNGIVVDTCARTSDEHIYAVGDCTYHHNPLYDRYVRLESVQNAVDQAKVVAAAITKKQPSYNAIPWFWSDQYDIKLQMVGLSAGHNTIITRHEPDASGHKFSVWYFLNERLLAVDTVNHAKAYVLATKIIKGAIKIDQNTLMDEQVDLTLEHLINANTDS